MTLKEKFKTEVSINTDGEAGRFANKCEQIADDYAIDFAKWLRKEDTLENAEKYFGYKDLDMIKEFKKEKGL